MRSCIKTDTERYILRSNGSAKKPLFVIGLNPSLADDKTNDPTFTRMEKIAKNNGFDGIIVVNLSPEISPAPENLHPTKDILKRGNAEIKKEIDRVAKTLEDHLSVWCAWGDNVEKKQLRPLRDNIFEIISLFETDGILPHTHSPCQSAASRSYPGAFHRGNFMLTPFARFVLFVLFVRFAF